MSLEYAAGDTTNPATDVIFIPPTKGTMGVAATTPIDLDASTGVISCPTCQAVQNTRITEEVTLLNCVPVSLNENNVAQASAVADDGAPKVPPVTGEGGPAF